MEIQLLVIGKTSSSPLTQSTQLYIDRLKHYVPFALRVLPDVKNVRNMTETQQKEAEGKAILAALQPQDMVVLLDERGRQFSSLEFSEYLEARMASGLKRLVFVVGGPYGFSQDVYGRANAKVSLSRMTFSHEMVRLFFVEQIYRAMTILRHEPYHHE